ncbi:YitT family protein [Halobacillus sp. A1]|uniref:YitT family protein n=1 Tax=Halobacillus sp. A1 TaxID=2880262 RepID=UPI0020A65331|nr:YitT family protein [Halobacillus sp. A1]MCP3030495.1 YitT family protein [Halobacillus sp. A1]
MKNFVKKASAILIGSVFLSLGINLFLIPHQVLDGGVIGLGLIANYVWDLQVGFTIICVSIPIFTIAWFHFRSYFYNSLHGLLVSSFLIDVLSDTRNYQVNIDPVVSSILGGVLVGCGIGYMLRHQTSTGGTDLLAQMIAKFMKVNVGFVILFIDSIVILLGGYLFSAHTLLLSTLTIISVALATMLLTSHRFIPNASL